MSEEKKENTQTQEQKPPERQFYDKPGEVRMHEAKKKLKSISWKKWLIGGTVILLLMFLALFSGRSEKKSKEPIVPLGEKRTVVTTKSMERAINASSKSKGVKMRSERLEKQPEKKKERKYDSSIAVFVAEPEEPAVPEEPRKEKTEETHLGLPSGTKVPALLTNRIISFNVAAPVLVVTGKDFIWKENIVIPKGSKFFGEASVQKTLDRINIRFTRLILPDDREIRIRAMALSEDGSSGIRGRVEKHGDLKIFKAIGETLLGTAALFGGGVRRDPFSLQDQLRTNLFENLTDQARQDLRDVRIEKSITVEAYVPVVVLLLEAT